MATIPVEEIRNHPYAGDVKIYKWPAITASDVGEEVIVPLRSDKTVHVFGTFGGAITYEGTLEPGDLTNWAPLKDPQGVPLSHTGLDIDAVQENVFNFRPVAAAGVSSVTVILMVR